MYYKRALPVFSAIYRPLAVERYVMMTMGGYWPVIQQLHDGRLGVATRDGDFHMGERGRLVFVTSADGGESWSRATVLSADGPNNANPALGVAGDGTLLACFAKMDFYSDGNFDRTKGQPGSATPLYIARSKNNADSWTKAELMDGQGHEQWSGAHDTGPNDLHRVHQAFGKMTTLPDGTMLMAYSIAQFGGDGLGKSAAFLIRSNDGGCTWVEPVTVAEGFGEPALCYLGEGHFLMMLRGLRDGQTGLWQSDSLDGGYSWTQPHAVTADREHPGDVIRLQDGRVLLTYGRRVPPQGIQGLISRDDGRTWDENRRLLLTADSGVDQGYPSTIQRNDGTIVTVYYSSELEITGPEGVQKLGVHGAALHYRPEDLP